MKVLFAVSNESISEGIVKQYQKEYKEILSYKNVYYFNAILKEIQKDKTYDRIIISEELEPFSNNNYEAIDKFLFEKLDNISDEAQDSNGQETSIIFICTDRRAKGSSFLVKLFSIGVYNALLGQDRIKSEVCKLINKPRIKKEAKMYYGIDAEDAKYDQSSDLEVTEIEIQNILKHFKGLGKNTDKYAESFNNIANQYSDEQLKIVINCLPINVKAVLESNSARYQEIMSASAGKIKSVANQAMEIQAKESGIKMDLIQNAKTNIERPIVIPSSVKRRTVQTGSVNQSTQSTGTVKRTVVSSASRPQVTQNVQSSQNVNNNVQVNNVNPQVRPAEPVQPVQPVRPVQPVQPVPPVQESAVTESNDIFDGLEDLLDTSNTESVVNTQPVNDTLVNDDLSLPGLEDFEEPEEINELPGMGFEDDIDDLLGGFEDVSEPVESNPVVNVQENVEQPEEIVPSNDEMDNFDLPGLEDFEENIETELPGLDVVEPETENIDNSLPGLDDFMSPTDDIRNDTFGEINLDDENLEKPVKKGRGRPRKIITEPPKPKGKRGRPRKVLSEDSSDNENDDLLDLINGDADENVLPGMKDDNILPGMDFEEEDEYTDEVSLPGLDELDDLDNLGASDLDETSEVNNVLPGMDFDNTLDSGVLPGFEDDGILPGMDFDDGTLPGFDDFTSPAAGDDILPGMDFDSSLDSGVLPGFEEESILPGMDDLNTNFDMDSTESVLPGFEDDDLLTTFEDSTSIPEVNPEPVMNNSYSVSNNNTAIESIKSNIDYSMSSLNSLLTKENKIVTFIGTTKNGTSFLVNNLALYFESAKINTAILDMTKNRNSYYIYTNSDEELRNISANAMENLEQGVAKGIRVKEHLTVYTAIPDNGKTYTNAEAILSTLVQNHSLILIDCDYDTDPAFFASCQEIYLVQSMDVLTIQPLTAFLKSLKVKGVLEPEKIRIAINKYVKLKEFSAKDFIAGMSCYNDPSMSVMTELFNREMVKFCIIDFEEGVYAKYLDSMASCKVNLAGYSKSFIANLKKLGEMVYPLAGASRQPYGKSSGGSIPMGYNEQQRFSNSTNSTLDKMRKKF